MPANGVVRAGGRLSPLMAKLRARRAERLLRGVRRDRLLDIGCGHYPFFLSRSDFARRIGLDRERGPAWQQVEAISLTEADIEQTPVLPFRDETFDAVTMLAVVEHIDAATLAPLLTDIRRVLTDEGRLVITTPPPWSDPVLRSLAKLGLASRTELEEHQSAYTPAQLRGHLDGAGFTRSKAGLFELGLNVWAAGDRSRADDGKRRSLRGLWPTILILAGTILLVVRERAAFSDALDLIVGSKTPLWLAAFAALVAGRGAFAGTSFVVSSKRLADAPAAPAAYAWLRSAITKYVPGVIWYPLTAVDRLRRFGVGTQAAALGFYVDAVASIAAAVLIGAVAIPSVIAEGAGTALWLLLTVPVVASLHPRVFSMAVRSMGRLTSRPIHDVELRWSTVGSVIGLHACSWLGAGSSLWLATNALGADLSWPLALTATSISWAVGLLAVPIPAGLGVREAVLVTLLVGELPAGTAVAAALTSRALFVALDVLCFAASFPVGAIVRRRGAK